MSASPARVPPPYGAPPRHRVRAWRAAVLLAALALAPVPRPAAGATIADARFERLSADYLARWLARNPHVATRLGIHDRDDQLFPVTEATLIEDAVWYRSLREQLAAIPERDLSFEHQIEHAQLSGEVDARLLDLEVLHPYQRNPGAYVNLVAGSVQSLLDRDFAAPCRRFRQAAARLRRVPEVLRAARILLDRPPRPLTETAILQFKGVLRLYREGIGVADDACRDPETLARLAEADTLAVRAVEEFIAFLENDLRPRSDGDFALGREAYQRKLAAEEAETTPVDSLLARGLREVAATRARMEALAEAMTPGEGVRGALDQIGLDHPPADSLIAEVSAQLETIRAFIRQHGILTMPAHDNLRVRETPPFRRGLSFASYDGPGPFETRADQAYYNVTPAEPTWSDSQREDHLAFFNRYASQVISIHEALPGHHVQGLYRKTVRSRLRQVLRSGSSSEGWAHYCEQMMIESGYGGGDPRMEITQLNQALQRLGRLVVGISLHTRGMTLEEAQRYFEDQCYMAPINATREAWRGTADPTYLVYTLGKWRILDLRDEVRAALGSRYSARAFHDALLRAGPAPLPLARRLVLRDLGVPTRD